MLHSRQYRSCLHVSTCLPLRWLPCLLSNHPKDYVTKCEGCPPIYINLVNEAPDGGQYYMRMMQLFHSLLLSENDWSFGG